jgi:hypothetical protein
VILKSFGCSFIFGSELHDDGWGGAYATPSKYTWPALWAKKLGLSYQCYARPGSGNVRIAEQVLNQIYSGEPAVYVIGWSWTERFDFTQRNSDVWRTITPWDEDVIATNYYRDIHSQYLDKVHSLCQANLVLQQLLQHDCKFYMTYMDSLMLETEFHCTPAMKLMQTQLQPYLHSFEGHNFLEWSRQQGFAIGTRGKHPLEDAHQAAYEYVHQRHSFW